VQSAAEAIEAFKFGLRDPTKTKNIMERKNLDQRIKRPAGTKVVKNFFR
jgi:hypothetical protein